MTETARVRAEVDRIERVLREHALMGERYLREKRSMADVCTCGSLHPQFDDGRWPTHRRHLAEQIAAIRLAPASGASRA